MGPTGMYSAKVESLGVGGTCTPIQGRARWMPPAETTVNTER